MWGNEAGARSAPGHVVWGTRGRLLPGGAVLKSGSSGAGPGVGVLERRPGRPAFNRGGDNAKGLARAGASAGSGVGVRTPLFCPLRGGGGRVPGPQSAGAGRRSHVSSAASRSFVLCPSGKGRVQTCAEPPSSGRCWGPLAARPFPGAAVTWTL